MYHKHTFAYSLISLNLFAKFRTYIVILMYTFNRLRLKDTSISESHEKILIIQNVPQNNPF